jgi:hypothetical protein
LVVEDGCGHDDGGDDGETSVLVGVVVSNELGGFLDGEFGSDERDFCSPAPHPADMKYSIFSLMLFWYLRSWLEREL